MDIAIKLMSKVIKQEKDSTNFLPAFLDTYANLLHKRGRTSEAIPYEEISFKLSEEYKRPWSSIAEIYRNLERMKKGKSTWVESD